MAKKPCLTLSLVTSKTSEPEREARWKPPTLLAEGGCASDGGSSGTLEHWNTGNCVSREH